MEIFFPYDKILHEKFPLQIPLLSTPAPNQMKTPLKRLYTSQ